VFKRIFLKRLKKLFNNNELNFVGEIEYLSHFANFQELLTTCGQKKLTNKKKGWIVYCKKPFSGPEQVIKYLGQYTHRIAISNYKLVKLDKKNVVFKVHNKDNPGKSKTISLSVKEFLRRFLLHVLPKRFVRIRHFSLLKNRFKKEKIELIRKIENFMENLCPKADLSWQELIKKTIGIQINLCPICKIEELIAITEIQGILNSS